MLPPLRVALAWATLLSLWATTAPAAAPGPPDPVEALARALSPGRVQGCAMPQLLATREPQAQLGAADRARVRQLLAPAAADSTWLSAQGRFLLSYAVAGTNAVDPTDLAPADGVPDLVQRCAEALEEAYDSFVATGLDVPDVSVEPYPVSFEAMSAYGYATDEGAGAAGTRIVLHNRFDIFPPNDDPEGDVAGSIRVTCAHELRHAGQFVTSQWSESYWIELDAVWSEERVFPQVNDYLQYLEPSSPIASPQTPLDNGGTGRYEDAVWELWMEDQFGLSSILDFWERRRLYPGENVLGSYDAVLSSHGSSLRHGFLAFAGNNVHTGARARAGFGYDEAELYPTSPLSYDSASYPAAQTSFLQHLSARFHRFSGLPATAGSTLELTLRNSGMGDLLWMAVLDLGAGGVVVQALPAPGDSASASLPTDLPGLEAITVVVADVEVFGSIRLYTVEADVQAGVAVAQLAAGDGPITAALAPGEIDSVAFPVANTGDPGSQLGWELLCMEPLPPGSGSTMDIPAPPITGPAPGSYLRIGSTLPVNWPPGVTASTVDIFFSRDGGTSWEPVAADTPDDGGWMWPCTGPATTEGRLLLLGDDGSVVAEDGPYTVYQPPAWLSAQPASGILAGGEQVELSLVLSAELLEPWLYPARLLARDLATGEEAWTELELIVRTTNTGSGPPPAALVLGEARPNPFNPSTTLALDLAEAGFVRAELLDLRGRRVRTLAAGWLPAGRHELRLDGRDDDGRPLASGSYRVRVEGAGVAQQRGVVLLK